MRLKLELAAKPRLTAIDLLPLNTKTSTASRQDGKGQAPDITKSKFLYCFLNSKLFRYFKRIKFVAYGDEYKTAEVDYGAEITPEATPAKEGYTFSGWSDHAAWYMYGTCYGICTENTYHA